MTTLNTIIEEKKKEFAEKIDTICKQADQCQINAGYPVDVPAKTIILSLLTTSMQRAYEAGQSEEQARIESHIEMLLASERARIRESFNEWFKNSTEDVEDWAERELGTITKDNLK